MLFRNREKAPTGKLLTDARANADHITVAARLQMLLSSSQLRTNRPSAKEQVSRTDTAKTFYSTDQFYVP